MSGIIYKMDFQSGKSYIGITKRQLNVRMRGHRYLAKYGIGNAVHFAWKKHGKPDVVVLAVVSDDDIFETEKRAIAVFNTLTPNGYNITIRGDSPSLTPSIREKISKALTGIKRSAETKKRISLAHRGKVISDDHKRKTSAKLSGRTLSDEHKIKIGIANKGKQIGLRENSHMKIPGFAKTLAAPRLGVPLSAEHREKMRLAWIVRRARKCSP